MEGPPKEPAPPPAEQPSRIEPPPPDPDTRPATLGEVRTLRRWLAVAVVWALAASAIAVIALLEARKEEEPKGPRAATGSQLARVRDDLNDRLDELEEQVGRLPATEDVRKLERRLKRVEDAAADTRGDVRRLNGDLDDLTERVDEVEQQSTTPDGTDTETTPESP